RNFAARSVAVNGKCCLASTSPAALRWQRRGARSFDLTLSHSNIRLLTGRSLAAPVAPSRNRMSAGRDRMALVDQPKPERTTETLRSPALALALAAHREACLVHIYPSGPGMGR